MRGCLQRVSQARVYIDGHVEGKISAGLVVLLGVAAEDTEKDIDWMVQKILHLRIFSDQAGQINRSLLDTGGELMVVSQFTLFGDCRKGRRPSFIEAAPPKRAEEYYEKFIQRATESGVSVASGKFRANMQIELVNDGPVTLWIDSRSTEG